MRTSRIMTIFLLLCFTFAGTSVLWAGEAKTKKFATKEGKHFIVELDSDDKIVKGVTSDGQNIFPEPMSKLSLRGEAGKFYEILNIPAGTVIYTKPGNTCTWYFDGWSWVRDCY